MFAGVEVGDVDPGGGESLDRAAGGHHHGRHAGHVVQEAEHRGDQVVVEGHQDGLQDVVGERLDQAADEGLQDVANDDKDDDHRNF